MSTNLKLEMSKRSRVLCGLLNVLRDDVDQVRLSTNIFDSMCIEETLKDTRTTLQMIDDNLTELEYYLYLAKNNNA